MIKALWFILRLSVFIGAVIWIAERPGTVQIDWLGTSVNVQMGLFLGSLFVLILFSIFVYRIVYHVMHLPAQARRYMRDRNKQRGYRALTLGLTAVAAGDTKSALREAKKARAALPEDHGLALLLEAQSARLDGREGDAQQSFVALLENKDAAFLGVRGLLQASLEARDYDGALRLAKKALALHPKQKWILCTVYDLQIRGRHWSDAQDILKRAVRAGAISKEDAASDRVAMALALAMEAEAEGLDDVALGQYKKARTQDTDFVPGAILFARYYARKGQRKKAVTLIERVWKKNPHPALVQMWPDLMAEKKRGDSLERLRWMERLVALNVESAEAQVAAGLAAQDAGLWGEARQHYLKAEGLQPSASVYRALAVLEEKANGDEEAARAWLEKASDLQGKEIEHKVWVCRETGRIYERWSPIAEPHGSFNTIEWGVPYDASSHASEMLFSGIKDIGPQDDAVIEAPKVA